MILAHREAALKGRPTYGSPRIFALKQDLSRTRTTIPETNLDDEEAFGRIRCPLCAWQPSPLDLWSCVWTEGSPELPFPSCGAIWNTFKTRGSCPGCRHQWRWTSCLRCAGWSLHEDWYEDSPA
jgi:hypothetical protein